MLWNSWGSSGVRDFVSPNNILFMLEKGWKKTELDEMDIRDFKFWYIETVNRHNREVQRQNDANGG